MLIILLLEPFLQAHVVLLEWIRIINRALVPVKNESDTLVLQQDLVCEMSESLHLN